MPKQNQSPPQKFTIRDFNAMFPDDASCLEWLKNHLYPNGIHCPKCDKVTSHYRVASRPSFSCAMCGHHVHPTADTIYHKSPTPLRLWFYAVYLMASTRCGISAKQLQRELGVTYKCAWRIFKQIRSMLTQDDGPPLDNIVEADETYIGGRKRGKRGRGAQDKSIVAGAVERKGRVIAKKVPDVKASTLIPFLQERILPEALVFTDELASYKKLGAVGYEHRRVHHTSRVYVDGLVHTNTIDGFWSLVKNGIRGVYHSVSDKYLQNYLDEYSFRYNRRDSEHPMFKLFLGQIQKKTCAG
jgi:transposase-like protein